MALELVDWSVVTSLREQVEALKARAERLSQERIDTLKEAWALEREIEKLTNGTPPPPRIETDDSADLLAQIPPLIDGLGPTTSTRVADHLNITPLRARAALQKLVDLQVLKSSGIGRGTLYGLADDEDLSANDRRASAHTLVRDAARKLDVFRYEELSAELPQLSDSSIRKVLPRLVAEGALSATHDGHRKIWAYNQPEGGPTSRPRHEAPELRALAEAPPERRAIEGTGRRTAGGINALSAEVRELASDVKRAGGQLQRKGGSHIQIYTGRRGQRPLMIGLPVRSIETIRSKLRAKGLDV